MSSGQQTGNAAALALATGSAVIGYCIPIAGAVLGVCMLLVLIAGRLDGTGGAVAELVLRPFEVLGEWLAKKDGSRWLRRAPVIGLVAGWMIRRFNESYAISGGA